MSTAWNVWKKWLKWTTKRLTAAAEAKSYEKHDKKKQYRSGNAVVLFTIKCEKKRKERNW